MIFPCEINSCRLTRKPSGTLKKRDKVAQYKLVTDLNLVLLETNILYRFVAIYIMVLKAV